MFKKVVLLAAVALPVLATSAFATDVDDTLDLSAEITGSCTNVVDAPINFGSTIVSLSSAITASTTMTVNCTTGIPYTIGITTGNNGGRFLADGTGQFIDYELYSDAGYSSIFQAVGTSVVGTTGNGADQSHTIYARLPVQTTPAVGVYTDQVLVTVRY